MADDTVIPADKKNPAGTPKAAQPEPRQVIYCGPSLPSAFALKQYQVFLGGLPEHVKKLADKCPAISALIVPVEQLTKVRLALTVQGSAESALYKEVQKAFLQGVKPE